MDDWRALSRHERLVLLGALTLDVPEAQRLREEASAVVGRRGCMCGCGTIELATLPELEERSVGPTLPVTGDVYGEGGEVVGGMVVFLDRDHRLYSLEIYSWDAPLQIPESERVRWRLEKVEQSPST